MKKIVTIIGARPQFIKTPLISEEIRKFGQEILVNTGQHYDENMSDVFVKELNISTPDYNLEVGSGTQGEQTARTLEKIEKVLIDEKPDMVVIYGDTNSTIAGALAAVKLHIPVAHVEAGMRSYNREMPEEINRVVTDHISSLLFCPTQSSADILKGEGIVDGVYVVGDVMADIQMKLKAQSEKLKVLEDLGIEPKTYLLATVHRQDNTDQKERLESILKAFLEIKETIVFPLHPRTKKSIELHGLQDLIDSNPNLKLIEPVGYFDMISLENNAKMILTDSGGVQKEAYLAEVPCVTLRDETEWIETVETGWNQLSGANTDKIVELVNNFPTPKNHPDFLGDGTAAVKIVEKIREYLES